MGMDDAVAVAGPELPKHHKMSMATMFTICVLTALLAVGGVAGVMLYMGRRGMLGGGPGAAPVVLPKKVEPTAVHPKVIEPLLINLADEGGHAYLRVALVLEEEDEPGMKGKEEAKSAPGADAAVKDTIFEVLGRETSAALLAADGKDRAKAELRQAIAASSPELRVQTIYFTDFLVQR